MRCICECGKGGVGERKKAGGLKMEVVSSCWLLVLMSLLTCKTDGPSDVAEHADEKLPRSCLAKCVPVLERIYDVHENRAVFSRLWGAESDVLLPVVDELQRLRIDLTLGWGYFLGGGGHGRP